MSSVAKIRKENNKISEKLNKDNTKIYTDFVCYLRVSDLKAEEQEEIISDVLVMFLNWQQEGKSIEAMVGGDMKKFADEAIDAVNPHKSIFKNFKENLIMIIECSCILLTINFVFEYLAKIIKGTTGISYVFDLSMLLSWAIIIGISYCAVNYIGKNSFKITKKGKHSKVTNFIFGASCAGFIIFTVIMRKELGNKQLFSFNIIYVAIIIGVYWIYKGINKFYIKK